MPRLSLAVDIADAVQDAMANREPMNIAETAAALMASHPEADANLPDVIDVLQDEVHAHLASDKPAS